MRHYSPNAFFIPRAEVSEVMRRGGFGTVTQAVRLLVPNVAHFRLCRGGYWGRTNAPRKRHPAHLLRGVPLA